MSLLLLLGGAVALFAVVLLVVGFLTADRVPAIKYAGAKIVVTGGSDGLGLHISQQLVQRGSHVIVIARNQAKLNQALDALKAVSVNEQQIINVVSGDVSDAASIQSAIQKASQLLGGGIDVLINNAGITRPGRFDDLSVDHIKRCIDVNLYGNVNAIKAILPIMKAQGTGGRIISVSSVLGLFGCMGYAAYAPSKAAIISLYETLQQEYYAFGIHFSVATPASIGTDSFFSEEQKIKPAETLELERDDPILGPATVAKPIVDSLASWRFLISPSGFNSFAMTTGCAGWGPASFPEVLASICLSGLFRIISLFAFNLKARNISIAHRSKEVVKKQ